MAKNGKKNRKSGAFDPEVFLATVERGRTVSNYRKDQVIFSQADPTDAVFYIQKGKVKIAVISEQGKEAVVAVLGAGEFFGEGCLVGQPLRLSAARVMTDSMVMRVEKGFIEYNGTMKVHSSLLSIVLRD